MQYDLTIVGAGIHGAAIAAQATARGYKVLVLEQFSGAALGTSSKSSKLIHGGLRYLESGQFKLVRECLAERKRLLAEHSDLVAITPFFIPVYRHTRRSAWLIAAGLSLYTLLGGKGFGVLGRRQWQALDGLRSHDLKTVFRYWDAQADDKQLTERLIDTAGRHGAEVCYQATFESAACTAQQCNVVYTHRRQTHTTGSRAIINASGPWVNRVLETVEPASTPLAIDLVQGTHIIVPGNLSQGIYYLEAPSDRRAVFVMPWQNNIMIGTTETAFQGDPATAEPLESEINYLLETWNDYFDTPLQRADVITSFAGVRVLPAGGGNAFNRSRDTVLHHSEENPRLLNIYGGKLTSHGHTASRAMEWLETLLAQ